MVLQGVCQAVADRGRHIVTSQIEHPSVLNPCARLADTGWTVSYASVDERGAVSPDEIRRLLRSDTVLISVMLANNETGVIQPLQDIAAMAREENILVHTDAAQAVGKIAVDVTELGVDYLTVAGHKLYAPKGIGALFRRKGAPFHRILYGAGQENGCRPGTEPVPLAVGLGEACRIAAADLETEARRQKMLTEEFFSRLSAICPAVVRHGRPDETLPNTLSVSFPGVDARELLAQCPQIMASTGAACHEKSEGVSHVLEAMGMDEETARGTVRFSMGRDTTGSDVSDAARALKTALKAVGH